MAQPKLYNLDRIKMDKLMAMKKWDACWAFLLDAINEYSEDNACQGLRKDIYLDHNHKEKKKLVLGYTALISKYYLSLILIAEATLSEERFYLLMRKYNLFQSIMTHAQLENTDEQIKSLLANKNKRLDEITQRKLCLLICLNTDLDIIDLIRKLKPAYRAASLVALLSDERIYSQKRHDNKCKLIKIRKEIENINVSNNIFGDTILAFFTPTYLDHPQKNHIKVNINNAFRKMLKHFQKEIKYIENISNAPSEQKTKPRIMVYGENMHKNNAMNRSFARRVKQLSEHFDVEFMVQKDKIDDEIRTSYSKIREVDFSKLETLFSAMFESKPDIVYLPSVGLNFGSMIIANYRFAPIQVMGLGFVTSSMSDKIDYVMGMETLYDPATFAKDTYIMDGAPILQTPTEAIQNLELQAEFPNKQPKNILNVAIVCSVKKITASFVDLLEEIQGKADFTIKFSFLCCDTDFALFNMSDHIKTRLQNAQFYANQVYDDYFKHLKRSDIVLNPFPHGHSNTLIDTFLAGKPCIGLTSSDPHSRTEYNIMQHLGLGDRFTSFSVDEYKDKFFKFAKEILAGKRDYIDPQNVYYQMFEEDRHYDYGKAMLWLYENHPRLQKESEKLYKIPRDATRKES